jgi:hypothetical protein
MLRSSWTRRIKASRWAWLIGAAAVQMLGCVTL